MSMSEGIRTNAPYRGTQQRIHAGWFRKPVVQEVSLEPEPEPVELIDVYQWIERELADRQLSRGEAGRNAGVGACTVSAILRFKQAPRPATVRKLAVSFGVDPQWAAGLPGVSKGGR